jgi:hypothetical protein
LSMVGRSDLARLVLEAKDNETISNEGGRSKIS